ncbi:hypothetical protein D3230_10175 [Leucobacter chromiireducens subsp. solipictus]|uniref:DNA-binding protein n=1 Tax=Leucobacter chromiireducens subsp. solipictus TaxID=398235 RepID=A0ABS1SIC2_9MICO|nr:hypothetical protein [Leucobacter chromiireducens subsp. solipictus]
MATVEVGTYTETETATRIGVDRTSVRRVALTKPDHPIARACLTVTENKRVYSRELIDAYVRGQGAAK